MKKRSIAIALILAMVLGMLAGCGGTSTETQAPANNETQAAAQNATEGKEITTLKILGPNYTYTGEGGATITLKDWVEGGDSQRWAKFTADLAERGIALELTLIEKDQYQTTCQTMAASGALQDYDIVNITPLDSATRMSLVEGGQIQCYSDIWEKYSDGTATEFFATEGGKYLYNHMKLEDGKVYWLSDFSQEKYNGNPFNYVKAISIRSDWLTAIGADVPTTIDEFYNVIAEFRAQDVNGSGVEDEVVYMTYNNFDNSVAQWFGLVNFTAQPDQNGVVTSPWYQDNVKAYFEFMQKLYKDEMLALCDWSQPHTNVINNNAACIGTDWATQTWHEPTVIVPEGAEPAWYIPFLVEAVEGEDPMFLGGNPFNSSNRGYAVTGSCDKLEAVAALLDYNLTSDYGVLTESGIEGLSFTREENGVRTKIIDSTLKNVDQVGTALWTNDSIMPRISLIVDQPGLENDTGATKYGTEIGVKNFLTAKEDYMAACYENVENRIFHDQTILAEATAEEAARINEISLDLDTYTSELILALVRGEKSLDDWDSYIEKMQELGLDELISITQARYDRGMK